jgi:hypothetical protein
MNSKHKVLTWKQLLDIIMPGLSHPPKNISGLITRAKNKGIGKQITVQKTEYSDSDLKKMNKLMRWWVFLDSFSNSDCRIDLTAQAIQDRVIDSVNDNKPITIFSVFCPSYKMGIGVYGYNGTIGERTRYFINAVSEFVLKSEEIGIMIDAHVYFSDLILENLDKLKGHDGYKNDLKNNYLAFCEEFSCRSSGKIKTYLLSDVPECRQEIGELGVISNIHLPNNISRQILDRNTVFYRSRLGWSDQQIKERTDIIIGSYIQLAKIFKSKIPEGIILWTESALERGLIYESLTQYYFPVIYPRSPDRVKGFFDKYGYVTEEVFGYSTILENFLRDIYINEKVQIFEHNIFHVIGYLGYEHKIYTVGGDKFQSLILIRGNTISFFTPNISDWKEFLDLIVDFKNVFPSFKIKIQNVSLNWIEENKNHIPVDFDIIPRSAEEAVYDVDTLVQLKGAQFSNLRNLKNKLASDGYIIFRNAKKDDFSTIKAFLQKWQDTQGYKYQKDKFEKELFSYQTAIKLIESSHGSICFDLGYFDNKLVCLCLLLRSDLKKEWGVLYSIKGLNHSDNGGVRGASDSAYMHAFRLANEFGISKLNDGELGTELGTRLHKMKFGPTLFLKSFDINIK